MIGLLAQLDGSGVTLSLESVVAVGIGIALKFIFDTWLPRKQEHEQSLVNQMSGQINTLLKNLMDIVQEKLGEVATDSKRAVESSESARANIEALTSVARSTDRKVEDLVRRLDAFEASRGDRPASPVSSTLPPKPVPRPR